MEGQGTQLPLFLEGGSGAIFSFLTLLTCPSLAHEGPTLFGLSLLSP